jgi:hypothetical protein
MPESRSRRAGSATVDGSNGRQPPDATAKNGPISASRIRRSLFLHAPLRRSPHHVLRTLLERMPEETTATDPVDELERRIRAILGKEAALFFPSGTMAQQVALRVQAERRGRMAFAAHPQTHLAVWEKQGYSVVHGLRFHPLGDANRLFTLDDLDQVVEPLAALLIELPQRDIGGQLPDWDDLVAQTRWATGRGAAAHLDGARLWEAQPAYDRPHAEIAALFDTVYVSLYKGLEGVRGAVLAGDPDTIAEANLWRSRLGGAIPDAWPLAAIALIGLDETLPRMAEFRDHAQALAVIPGHVVDKDLHRSEPSQRGVGSMVVVMVEPRTKRQEPLVVRGVRASVGPLVEHRPVEALRLPVGLRPERPGPEVTCADLVERLGECPRHRVVAGVVGHDPLDPDTKAGEERGSLAQERRAGRPALIGEDRGVRHAAHVVDDLVDVVVAAVRAGRPAAPASEAVTAAVGDPPELLDIHVQQFARSLSDIADRDARRAVPIGQARQTVARQDVADGGARHPDDRGQAMGTDTQFVASSQDGVHPSLRQGAWRMAGPGRSILKACQALSAVATDPFRRGLPTHAAGLGRAGDRPAIGVDAIDQEPSAEHGQLRPTMCHESLPFDVSWIPTPSLGRLSLVNNVFVNHT